MDTTIRKWGNSLAIRIPKAFADEVGLDHGSQVELQIMGGQLVLRPIRKPAYDLATLLSQVTVANQHAEVDMGASAGDEVW
jgi:antitoxin MazE